MLQALEVMYTISPKVGSHASTMLTDMFIISCACLVGGNKHSFAFFGIAYYTPSKLGEK